MADSDPPQEPDAPASGRSVTGLRAGVLRLVNPLAGCVLFAWLFSRALAPQLRGLVVGADAVVYRLEQLAGFVIQIVAMAAEVITIAALLVIVGLRVHVALRAAAVVAGGAVLIATLASSVRAVPEQAAVVVGALGAIVGLVGAVTAQRAPFAAAAARVVGAASLAGVARVVTLTLALGGPRYAGASRVAATFALALHGVALVLAMTSVARRAAPVGPAKAGSLFDPGVVVSLVIALVGVRGALGDPTELGAAGTLIRRTAEALSLRPHPFGWPALTTFVSLLAPCLAVACLARKAAFPALAGVAALALVAAPTPEAPLAGLSLLLSGLALCIVARDPEALWAAMPDADARSPGTN